MSIATLHDNNAPPARKGVARITWLGENVAEIDGLRFSFDPNSTRQEGENDSTIYAMKHGNVLRQIIDRLRDQKVETFLEIGVLRGGSLAFWHKLLAPAWCAGMDVADDEPDQLLKYVASPHCKAPPPIFFPGRDQGDRVSMRPFVQMAPGVGWLDLVIDDASHQYEPSRRCFEEVFPNLREGGLYVLEDWSWAHWPSHEWRQRIAECGYGVSLTTLVTEILSLAASEPLLVSKVEIWPGFIVVTRGPKAISAADFSLNSHMVVLGRKFVEVLLPAAEIATPVTPAVGGARGLADVLDEAIGRYVVAEQRAHALMRTAELSDQREHARAAGERHGLELTRLLEERSAQLRELKAHSDNAMLHHANLLREHRALEDRLQDVAQQYTAARKSPFIHALRMWKEKIARALFKSNT